MITASNVVSAIWVVEGGKNTKFPYGIMMHYKHTSPHDACLNTVNHALKDYKCVAVDRAFIYYLSDKYCPPSVDKIGNKNWRVNMMRILNIK